MLQRAKKIGILIAILACVFANSLPAQTPASSAPPNKIRSVSPIEEFWEVAYVENEKGTDVKIGYIHLTSKEVVDRDQKLIRTTKELRFTIKRGTDAAELKADVTADESPDGKVAAVRAKLWLGKDRIQNLDCVVENEEKIKVTADGEFKYVREYKWDPNCIGLSREQTILRDQNAKTGDKFSYRYFEPQVTAYVTVRVEVGKPAAVAIPGGLKRLLVPAVATPDPLKLSNGGMLQLPAATFWFDEKSYEVVKTKMNIPEIGVVSLVRASKIAAMAPNGNVPDLMKRQSIYLRAPIEGMHNLDSVVYRVTFQEKANPKELISSDNRQTIKNIEGNSFDLHVKSVRSASAKESTTKVPDEFLKSNYFINSDDALVKELAARAVGNTTDPWKKAQKIEAFVRQFMRPSDYTEAMAPADHVAKTRTGDCTEYSMLTAAMCRAVKIPSRTAIGLVYVDNLLGRPGLGFHMWTEVMINGAWLGIDATLAKGSIGPGHIKITDHSWSGVISFTPLLPVKGFIMANPTIEVTSTK